MTDLEPNDQQRELIESTDGLYRVTVKVLPVPAPASTR